MTSQKRFLIFHNSLHFWQRQRRKIFWWKNSTPFSHEHFLCKKTFKKLNIRTHNPWFLTSKGCISCWEGCVSNVPLIFSVRKLGKWLKFPSWRKYFISGSNFQVAWLSLQLSKTVYYHTCSQFGKDSILNWASYHMF